MAPPTPLTCPAPDCQYQTPANTPTWDNMLTLLNMYLQMVHPNTNAPAPAAAASVRLDRLPRPTFSLNMSEAAWDFTVLQWDKYIQQVPTSPATKLNQLGAACDAPLHQCVFDSGDDKSLTTAELLLAKMKELAVTRVHQSVHLKNLHQMVQQPEETIRVFMARVTGTADMCGMVVTKVCSADGCTTENKFSYRDEVVKQVIIHGMTE